LTKDIFNEFELSIEEMICVRGGDAQGDPITLPNNPPVRI
jgi:hypothetical protein